MKKYASVNVFFICKWDFDVTINWKFNVHEVNFFFNYGDNEYEPVSLSLCLIVFLRSKIHVILSLFFFNLNSATDCLLGCWPKFGHYEKLRESIFILKYLKNIIKTYIDHPIFLIILKYCKNTKNIIEFKKSKPILIYFFRHV